MSSSLILCNNKPFSITSWYVMKSGFYMTTSNEQLSGCSEVRPKTLLKAKLSSKKANDHCLADCCPSDLLQLSEYQWNHYIWQVCLANNWNAPKAAMPGASIGQQKGYNSPWQCLTAHHITNASKVEWVGLWSFASSNIFSTWPLTNWLPLLQTTWQHFAEKMQKTCCRENQQDAENAFQDFTESLSMDFYVTEINQLIFYW